MSFSKERREAIKTYILEKIADGSDRITEKVRDTFGISDNTIFRYLRQLQSEGIICKASGSGKYSLVSMRKDFRYDLVTAKKQGEDFIYKRDILPLLGSLPFNVIQMWDYCFTEMLNNALDHSGARTIVVTITNNHLFTKIALTDDGIGIFRKIKEYWQYETLDEAVAELFKGKLTTDSENHSGEGIFFTSRICDEFAAISDGKCFSHSHYEDILRDVSEYSQFRHLTDEPKGTLVLMKIANHSQKQAADIFNRFADVDGGFTKTSIPLKHIYERYPVARSQAKRLTKRFESFEEVELDFDGISEIGQGFADQLFRVYGNQHPEVSISVVNANENIRRMIHHVKQ